MIGLEVELHGRFLTGDPLPPIDQFVEDSTWVVAQQGMANWHRLLDINLKHPTPVYETMLMMERMTTERVDVHDQGMVYGPWLEGTGSRNRTTKFKGYRSLRQATQMLNRSAPNLVQPYVERLITRLDGA